MDLATPRSQHRSAPRPLSVGPQAVPGLLRLALHGLVLGLLVLCAARAVVSQTSPWPIVIAALVVGVVYGVGPTWVRSGTSARLPAPWLTLLLLAWVGLLALTPDAVYLAFAWFFLLLHLLPRGPGLVAVVLTTAVAVAGFGWHQSTFTAAMVIGPVLGAAVVIATVWGYEALQTESEQRRRLIIELEATRADLAAAERNAGVLSERERLAREIHDTLAQGLTSIQLLLRAAGRSLDPSGDLDASRAAALVEQARQSAQGNLEEARRFVRALSPGDLESSSLYAALQRLSETTTARSGLPVHFHHEGATAVLPTPVEVALLRIAQSALANTTQHAQATRVDLTVTVMDGAVTLDVVDDGRGFDPEAPTPIPTPGGRGGFGLTSMRTRAADLGGRLSVESSPGQGAAVAVQFALPTNRAVPEGQQS